MGVSKKPICDWVGSLFWLSIGIYVAIYGYYKLGLGELHHPGPGFIFFLSALFLISMVTIDMVITSVEKSKSDKVYESMWEGVRWKKLGWIIGVLIAYTFLMDYLGFILSTFLLMTALFLSERSVKWWVAIVSSLLSVSVTYVIFKVWLMIPFPTGVLGF